MSYSKFRVVYLFSLISLISIGCATGPTVSVLISSPKSGGFNGVDEKKQPLFIDYGSSQGLVCFKQDELNKLLTYCGTGTNQPIP